MLRYATEQNDKDDLEHPEDFIDDGSTQKIKWYDQVLLNRPSKVILTIAVCSIVLPLLFYNFVLSGSLDLPPSDGYSTGSCLIPRSRRIICGYGNVTEDRCHQQCCYDLENNVCFQRVPSRFSYLMDREWTEGTSLYPRVPTEPFSNQLSIQTLMMSVDEVSETHVTFQIYDPAKVAPRTGKKFENKLYEYEVSSPEIDIKVRSGNRILLQTDRGPLIASDNIWEISFLLTNETMYGLDEIPLNSGVIKVIYNSKDTPAPVPLIFARNNGSFHGFLFDSVSPTEIHVLAENHVLIRTLTDDSIRFHVFVGPTPADIMQDVLMLTGGSPEFSYWMLGLHVCSEISLSMTDQIEQLTEFIAEAKAQKLPIDSHCGLGPIILGRDEYSPLIESGAKALEDGGIRFVPHLSPYIYADEMLDDNNSNTCLNNCIKYPDQEVPFVGNVGGLNVLYPDYTLENSSILLSHLWLFDGISNGIILENNWPLDESEKYVNETGDYLPYMSQDLERAFKNTIPWNSTYVNPQIRRPHHMYHHNAYGENFATAVRQILDANISLYSSSKWMNSKDTFNRQNVDASWTNLRRELIEASMSGISGSWLRSSPICGDTISFDRELQSHLCVKWYMASTYMPLIKIDSRSTQRDPLAFEGMDKYYMLQSLHRRLSLLPYISTVLRSGPLLRPMFYQYPEEETLHDLSSQFNVGDSLLIAPNLLPQQTAVNVWLPAGVWYEMWSGLKMQANERGYVTMPSTTADFLTLIRAGDILVIQEEVQHTAEETRLRSPFSFIIALHCHHIVNNETEDESTSCHAKGKLTMSDRMTLRFTANSETLTILPTGDDFGIFCDAADAIWSGATKGIKIYGLDDSWNNFDTYRYLEVNLFLCAMQMTGQTVVRFV